MSESEPTQQCFYVVTRSALFSFAATNAFRDREPHHAHGQFGFGPYELSFLKIQFSMPTHTRKGPKVEIGGFPDVKEEKTTKTSKAE